VGSRVLGEEVDDGKKPDVLVGKSTELDVSTEVLTGWPKWMATIGQVGKPLLLGAFIFSVVFSALAYALVNGIWHWRVKAKRRRRLGQSALAKSHRLPG
jgi:uncharacterized protein (DUF2062 family)